MKKRRLRKGIIYFVYGFIILGFGISVFFINKSFKNKKNNTKYVNDAIFTNEIPVVKQSQVINKPYNDNDITLLCNYYDYKTDEQNQQKSIIYYNGTYIQNNGLIYGRDNVFDIVSIYDGEVIKIDENSILGKIVEIRHSNDVISTYQLLSETTVQLNQTVKQGDVIGRSGSSNILNNDKQLLYFELSVRGEYVNAESYYGLKINEL